MENETIEARVRRFLKFAGVGQLLLKESVGSARALEILRAIDVSSLLRCPSARKYPINLINSFVIFILFDIIFFEF